LALEQSWKRLRDGGVEREAKLQPVAADGTEESRHRNAEGVAR